MAEFLRELLNVGVLVFSVCTMLSVGLGHTVREVLGPMLDARGVLRAVVANFVLVPLLAFAIVQVLPMNPSYGTGLMLVATAAGAAFLIKLTAAAGGNLPLSASLTMLLVLVTVLYMPFVVPFVAPDATVSAVEIGLPLIETLLVPLGAGLFFRARRPEEAERLSPWLGRIASAALIVLVAATVLSNLGGIVRIVLDGAILAPVLLILGAFVIGYAFGREYRGGHVVLGLGTAQRNVAAAMVVATQGLEDQNVVVMVVVASLVQFAVLFPIAWLLARRTRRQQRLPSGGEVHV